MDKSVRIMMLPISRFLTEYKELNVTGEYRPVAVGRYGIRTRESIYSKDLAQDYTKNKLIYKGTLTVGMGSVQMDIGILSDDVTYSVSPAYHTYRINGIDYDYLRYCLQCRNMDMFTRYMKRGSRQGKSIDLGRWITYEIPVYEPGDQLEIVDRLNRAQNLITQRQSQLSALDDLIKARFVEMFGNPIRNEKGFETKSGEDVFKLSNGKFVPEHKRLESGIPVYGGNGISWFTDEILLEEDTVVVGRVGFQSGNVHLAEGPLWISDNAMYISELFDSGYDLRFLYWVMEHIDFTRYQDAGDLKKITQKPFMQMKYIKPPISMQRAYNAFVSQVDKSKVVVQAALDKAQTLFDSLMQQFFG